MSRQRNRSLTRRGDRKNLWGHLEWLYYIASPTTSGADVKISKIGTLKPPMKMDYLGSTNDGLAVFWRAFSRVPWFEGIFLLKSSRSLQPKHPKHVPSSVLFENLRKFEKKHILPKPMHLPYSKRSILMSHFPRLPCGVSAAAWAASAWHTKLGSMSTWALSPSAG